MIHDAAEVDLTPPTDIILNALHLYATIILMDTLALRRYHTLKIYTNPQILISWSSSR